MEKKQWESPILSTLNVDKTEIGPSATTEHDAYVYDNEGNWWAGGQS